MRNVPGLGVRLEGHRDAEMRSPEPVRGWRVPAHHVTAFKVGIDRANRRLARSGLAARFDVVYADCYIARCAPPRPGHSGRLDVYEPWVAATLTRPLTLTHGHFTFLAVLIREKVGVTVHRVPGQDLGDHSRQDDLTRCDHCGLAGHRSRLYLIRDERSGTISQVGHSCVESYTGFSRKGLWALTFDRDLQNSISAKHAADGFRPQDYSLPVDVVLSYAFAHSDRGRSYVPVTMSARGPSTVDRVRASLFADYDTMSKSDRYYFIAKAGEAADCLADKDLIAAIKASVATIGTSATLDALDLAAILADGKVADPDLDLLVSLVKVHARAQHDGGAGQAPSSASAGFLEGIGKRITGVTATATTVVHRGAAGTMLIAVTDDGHMILWRAHKPVDIYTGQRFEFASATVKAHETYRGVDHTVFVRPVKFKVCRRTPPHRALVGNTSGQPL